MKKWMLSLMLISLLFTSPLFGLRSLDNTTVYAADTLQNATIGEFESDEELWNFYLGTEFPGAKGEYVRDTSVFRSGTYSGKLRGDFSTGGKYVSVSKNFIPMDIQKLEFWFKTVDAAAIVLRVTDSTGQVHQQKLAVASNANWQKIEITKFNGGTSYLHFGGANDGVWHGAAQGIGLLLEKSGLSGGKTSGNVWFDDVSATVPQQEPLWDSPIGNFENAFDIWKLTLGAGAKGQYVRDSSMFKEGSFSGKLSGDFSGTGKSVSLGRYFSPREIKKLGFWVKTTDAAAILVVLKDSTGQVHQQKVAVTPNGNWQKIEVFKFTEGTSYLHYNGANDGVWHGPAQGIGFIVEKSGLIGGKTSGDIRLDNIVTTSTFPDLSIEQSRMGNVFLANESAAFPLVTRGDTVSWSVYDHLDHQVLAGSEGVQDRQLNLTIPIQQLGYYKLSLAAEKDGQTIKRAEISFARLAEDDPTLANNSPFGVSTHLARTSTGWTPELSTLLKRAGSKNFRDEITWVDVENEKGKYQKPPGRDAFMRKTQQDGLKPFITFDFTNPFYDQDSTPYSDEGRQGFANYGKALLDLYGNQMEWVEVYNEFNGGFGDRGNGPADSRPDYYFKLLKKTYETVKAARPDVTVVGMASNVDIKWMEEVFKLGGLQYMDVVSIHPYNRTSDGMLQDILAAKSLIRTYNQGQDKPIWITEIGWKTNIGATGVVEKTQADYLVRAYVQALSAGVEKIFWYDLMNDGMQADYGEDNFGLIRHQEDPKGQFTPKPAYAAYGAMTRELLGATFVEQEAVGTGITSYRFDKNGQKLRVVWANTPVQAAIQTDSPIKVTDIMGNTETFTPLNGKVYMTLTAEPIYIQSEINGITVDSTFAVTGDEAVTGEPVALTVEAKNSSASPLAASFTVEGSTYSLNAGAGQNTSQPFALPGLDQEGIRYVTGDLTVNGNLIGRLKHEVQTLPSYHARIIPVITDVATKAEALHIQIQNNSKQLALTVRKANWQFGTQSGIQDLTSVIPPDTTKSFDIPLSGFNYGVSNQAQVTVQFDGKQSFVYGGKLDFNPILPGTVQIDGSADPAIVASPPVALLSQGTVKMQNYTGASDLDGSVWVNWDQDHFYLTATIKDNVHYTTVSGAEIWKNDSLQFAAMAGTPGENLASYEFGLSQTPLGPQIYRWLSPNTSVRELVTNGSLQVSRNEDQKLTVYELALPWSELAPIKPETNGAISFSLLVNDNDGTGRKGYIEWGSGIGETKDPKKFRTVQWIITDETPPVTVAELEGTKQNGWYVTDVKINLIATDDKSSVTETVYSLDGGTTWTKYQTALVFKEDGVHTLSFRSVDQMGNKEQSQTISFAIDQTPPTVQISGGGTYTVDQTVTVTCSATDTVSGVVYSSCTAPLLSNPAYLLNVGDNIVSAYATDAAGNSGTAATTITVKVTVDSMIRLIEAWITGNGSQGIVNSIETKLRHGQFDAFINEVHAQKGKKISEEAANYLLKFVNDLK
ncbi:OmpL47-type beta-barrel domain-containing protein [Paenibacillus phytorum]|nr:sugar-binding protein [Paenibacillus phytorum]